MRSVKPGRDLWAIEAAGSAASVGFGTSWTSSAFNMTKDWPIAAERAR
ncbi:hypothetical protein ACFSR7_15115 [Cohnella sp. GCM10020058]